MKENNIKRNHSIVRYAGDSRRAGSVEPEIFNSLYITCLRLWSLWPVQLLPLRVDNWDDSNPGTQTAPWRTVQHAADTVRAGSTVNVRGGVYEELVSIKASGNATDGYITLRSYPGETAVLDAEHCTPSGRSGILTIQNKSYVRIEGFEILNFRNA